MDTDRMARDDEAGQLRLPTKKLIGAIGATTVLALAAGGMAAASSAGGTHSARATVTASTAAKPTPSSHPLIRRLLRRTVHAQFVVRAKGGALETFDVDRGVLRSVTSSTIVIAPADAPTTVVSATITSKTHFRGLPEGQLQPGDRVVLVYQGGNAVVVRARAPKSTPSPGS
jgi:hypothetical protein